MRYSDRQTPAGIYTLYYKKSPDVLRGKQLANGKYEYEQPVTYWMPFNGGIGSMMQTGSHTLAEIVYGRRFAWMYQYAAGESSRTL